MLFFPITRTLFAHPTQSFVIITNMKNRDDVALIFLAVPIFTPLGEILTLDSPRRKQECTAYGQWVDQYMGSNHIEFRHVFWSVSCMD